MCTWRRAARRLGTLVLCAVTLLPQGMHVLPAARVCKWVGRAVAAWGEQAAQTAWPTRLAAHAPTSPQVAPKARHQLQHHTACQQGAVMASCQLHRLLWLVRWGCSQHALHPRGRPKVAMRAFGWQPAQQQARAQQLATGAAACLATCHLAGRQAEGRAA